MDYPTVEQIMAVQAFAAENGRTWKSSLRHCWETGRYSDYSGTDRSDLLQQVRNSFGPSWLVRFRLPDPQCKMAEFPGDRICPNCKLPFRGHQPCGSFAKATLKTIGLTNGEFGTVCELVNFLMWMKQQSAPIPERFDGEECDHLMVRYVKHARAEQMQRVSELRVSRGQSPLPDYLLGVS